MDHYGFGFDWKELHARAKADMDHFESVFNDLGPTLFSSSKELLNHIERNGLHEDGARKIPLCHCATVSTDNDSKDTSRSEEHQEFENSFKMSVMCASYESGDKIVHYCTSAVIHLLFEYGLYAHDLYENTHDLSLAIGKHDYGKVEDWSKYTLITDEKLSSMIEVADQVDNGIHRFQNQCPNTEHV